MIQENATPFTTVLTVSPNREHLRRDRNALRQAGIPAIIVRGSVEKALTWLGKNRADLVILDADLDRTSGVRVLKLLRRRQNFADLPVIIADADGSREAVLEAMAAGCSGFLVRPYSHEGFVRQCRLAAASPGRERTAAMEVARRQLSRNSPRRALQALEQAVTRRDEARQHYIKGCEHLTAERFELALGAFNKAVSLNALFAEAYIGMANAWEALGEPARARSCMRRAVRAHAQISVVSQTRKELARILKDQPASTNPFLDLGFALVRREDYVPAGQAYALALQHSPTAGQTYAAMARACLFTTAPSRAAKALSEALVQAGAGPSPGALYKRIMGDIPPLSTARAGSADAAEAETGVMNDIWAVLKYTWKLYRNGGPITPQPLPLPLDF